MNRIKTTYLICLVPLLALLLAADRSWPQPFAYGAFRTLGMQYSGIIATAAMSIVMLLALRPRILEPYLDGLDKMYRLHKWLGITALVVSVAHWWLGQGTKWMTGWGWLTRGPRGPRPDHSQLGALEGWMAQQHGLAESVGDWAFYAVTILLVLALVKRFPYHLFAKTHTWLAALYLLLAFHSVVLTKFEYWSQPLGWVLAVLIGCGSAAAVLVLAGRVGAGRKTAGTVESVVHYPGLDVLETRIATRPGWPGHAAGQFAFVTSDRREGAHPFTIASAWDARDGHITFITKSLGDYTGRLRHELTVGAEVTVEGPYGCFDFEDGRSRQIWIGAGIGITPFLARMQQLARSGPTMAIDLFHPTAVHEEAAIEKLKTDAAAAGVALHLLADAKDGRLDGGRIRAAVPDWANASIWFCGPPRFGETLRADFVAHGLPAQRFHQEMFEMR
jgi:predicted ferric reductase